MTNSGENFFLIGNIGLLACALICLVCYDIFGGLWLKGLTSSWFAIIGCLNLLFALKSGGVPGFVIFVLLGLIFGMAADILLGIEFIFGILAFALGHIFYLVAFCRLESPRWSDLIFILPLVLISIIFVAGTPFIKVEDPLMKKLVLGYAVIIACMLGKAIANYLACREVYSLLILIGSIMFWFSDLILAIDMFGTSSRLTWVLCAYSYWPAQCIIAFSLFFYTKSGTGVI